MKYFLFIILTFISCNLIAEENPIQQIDKETFCKEAIQETEKNECYKIKKYFDEFLYEQWFGIYSEEDDKIGYSFYIETLHKVDEKYYFTSKSKDVYLAYFGEVWGERAYSYESTFQAHYPFKLVRAEVIYSGDDTRFIGVTKDNDIVVIKKNKEEETKIIIKEFDYNLYDFVEGSHLLERQLKVGDVFNTRSLDLTLIEEEEKIVDNFQYKLQGIESRVINEQSVKVFIFDYFYEDVNGNYKKFGQEVFDEKFHTIEAHYYYEDSSQNEIHISAPEEIARQIHYGDNVIYLGEHQAGLPHGRGKMVLANVDQYDGEWMNGKMHGKGIYTHQTGTKYEGDWVKGKKHGKGIYTFESGDRYEGDYFEDFMQGQGIYTHASGDRYEGAYVEDLKHGQGIFYHKSGGRYEGNHVEGFRYGQGKMIYYNGDVYEGNWAKDERNGYGKYTFANGDVYEGNWENNKFISD